MGAVLFQMLKTKSLMNFFKIIKVSYSNTLCYRWQFVLENENQRNMKKKKNMVHCIELLMLIQLSINS